MIHKSLILFLLALGSGFADVITNDEHPNRGLIPETLKGITEVYEGNLISIGFRSYSVPKPEDPKDAVYREERIAEVFYRKGASIALNCRLEALLQKYDSARTSEVELFAPYKLIAVGTDGSYWLITVGIQQAQTTILPLRTLSNEAPLDQIYWPNLASGYYQSDGSKLQQILRSSDLFFKNDAEQGSQKRLNK